MTQSIGQSIQVLRAVYFRLMCSILEYFLGVFTESHMLIIINALEISDARKSEFMTLELPQNLLTFTVHSKL